MHNGNAAHHQKEKGGSMKNPTGTNIRSASHQQAAVAVTMARQFPCSASLVHEAETATARYWARVRASAPCAATWHVDR